MPTEFKSGPKLHFRMDENGRLIQIPEPLPAKNPITFEMNVVDEDTINICPPKHA